MKRRQFLTLLGSTVIAWPDHSHAEKTGKLWRIGIVHVTTAAERLVSELERQLGNLGYVHGKDIVLIDRSSEPNLKSYERTILSLIPDIDLLVVGGTTGGIAAKNVVTSIPVVFISVGAPIEIGLVESLSHPGGNMTGITFEAATETYGKRLQILKEIIPTLRRVAVLQAKDDANVQFAMNSLERAAPELEVRLLPISVGSSDELGAAFDEMKRSKSDALIVVAGVLTYTYGQEIADLALAHRLPSCHAFRETVVAGGLVSLGPDLVAMWGQAAKYIDKIIHGAQPRELPVEQPTRYELAINLKTAKVLGLNMPPTILVSAAEVIE